MKKSCRNFFTLPSASLVIDFENISTLTSSYGICLQVSQKHISYKHPTRNGVLAFLQDYKKMDIVSIKKHLGFNVKICTGCTIIKWQKLNLLLLTESCWNTLVDILQTMNLQNKKKSIFSSKMQTFWWKIILFTILIKTTTND